MWTNKVRRLALRLPPPGKLLPDRQPAYVKSWIYVFGVATLAALTKVPSGGLVDERSSASHTGQRADLLPDQGSLEA